MQLSETDILEFIDLWKAEFGETLTAGQAQYHASRLLELYIEVSRHSRREPGTLPDANHETHTL